MSPPPVPIEPTPDEGHEVTTELRGHDLEVQLGHLCNNRCVFCSSGLLTEMGLARPVVEEPILEALAEGRRRGATRVTFLGGEPTLHKSFIRALECACRSGFEEIVIFTNGVRLAEEGFIDSVLALEGPFTWRISIQGGDEAAHDAATQRAGSFRKIVTGLERLRARGQRVTANMCVNEQSYRSLPGFPALMRDHGIRQLHVDVVRPASTGYQDGATGVRSLEHLRAIMPRYSEMVPFLRSMLEGFERTLPDFDVNVGNLPYCLMPEWERRIHHGGELTLTRSAGTRELEAAADKYAVHYAQRRYLPGCEECVFRPRCSGIFAEYLDLYGGDEFQPVRAAPRRVSNSFDYVPVRRLDGFRLDPLGCSATTLGLSRLASSRLVVVGWDGEYVLCRTRTRDFDEGEIRGAVHGCGQLYLDRSGKTDLEDLRDVEQLVLSAACRDCAELPTCIGTYVPAETARSFFEDDEDWLRLRLRALSGRVLDVGMGQLPYLDLLADAIRTGRVEYHGIDPDPSAVARAESTGLPLSVHPVGIEDFPAGAGAFDHAVAVRSLHHFPDLGRALAVLCAALKPGGRLLLVESLPLPLVRSGAASRRSQRESRGGFQHYRNWDSWRLLEYIQGRLPLTAAFHRPVGRDTCDQWILELTRTASVAG